MQDHGYIIIRYDKELNSLVTEKYETKWGDYRYQVQAFIREKDGIRIHMFGNYTQVTEDGKNLGYARYEDGLFKHPELSFLQNLIKIAKAFPDGQVKYGKLL